MTIDKMVFNASPFPTMVLLNLRVCRRRVKQAPVCVLSGQASALRSGCIVSHLPLQRDSRFLLLQRYMLTIWEKLAFVALACGSGYFAWTGFRRVFNAIARGKADDRFENLGSRVGRALWIVFTQQSVFKMRPAASALHAVVFYGFIYYFLVNVVDFAEGFSSLHARGGLWNPFNLVADLLTTGVLLSMTGLLVRRFWVHPEAFTANAKVPIVDGVIAGIRLDSLIVGGFILFHVGCRLFSKATQIAHTSADPYQPVASALAALFSSFSEATNTGFEHLFWWGALGSILIFLPYFPRSKHIHLFLAPLNLALRKDRAGVLEPMDFENEETFGAARLEEMPWPRLLDAYSCIMCNRCQDVCPAHATGKALSPAALLINERYELNRILPEFAAGKVSPRPLLEFAINEEATWACTTCNACVEVCPVGNEQLLHIMDIRRERVLMEASFPGDLKTPYHAMETIGTPFGIAPEKRLEWTEKLDFEVPTLEKNPAPDVLYWVGCAVAFEPRAQLIAQSMARILERSGLSWAVLGAQERCTGDPARRTGNEYLFAEMAAANAETLNQARPKLIVTTCPHCLHTIRNEYPQFGGAYEVKHHTELIDELVRSGKLELDRASRDDVTFHDPCYLGRHNGVVDEPRNVLASLGGRLKEPQRTREQSFCCGAGGGQFWKSEEPGTQRVSQNRYRELRETGARTVATGCPFCMKMFTDEAGFDGDAPAVMDVAELVARSLKP